MCVVRNRVFKNWVKKSETVIVGPFVDLTKNSFQQKFRCLQENLKRD